MSASVHLDDPVGPDLAALARGCLLAGFHGPRLPDWLAAELDAGLGGVTLFATNVADERATTALVAAITTHRPGAVIAIDEEGGEVSRLDATSGSRVVGAAALGALDEPAVTEDVHATLGRRLAALGITVDLAPVADVNSEPRNPVIGVRSFGADPGPVARHVAAAVRGLQSTGVAACAKHFPGHGDTSTDSHTGTARVDRGLADLERVDLPPFVAAIDAGVRAVMTGHLLVPALDAELPASLSPAITTGLLRERLGFDGTVITDALEMAAVADLVGIEEGAVLALAAGADCLCLGAQEHPDLPARVTAAIVRAVRDGRLSEQRLRQAAVRTRALGAAPSGGTASSGGAAPSGGALTAHDVADRAIEVVGRLPDLVSPVVVEYHTASSIASGELGWSLGGQLTAAGVPDVRTVPIGPGDTLDPALVADPTHSLVLVVRDPVRHPEQRATLDAVRRTGAVVVDVGWPDPTDPHPGPAILTRGTAPDLLSAAARRLRT